MTDAKRRTPLRLAAAGAVVVGLAMGSYGIANAASGSGSGSASGLDLLQASPPASIAPSGGRPWGGQRSDETLLTGDTAAKVQQAALAELPGATVIRVETDADGNAMYEAHVVKSDGTPATVYVNAQFEAVRAESGMPAPPPTRPNA